MSAAALGFVPVSPMLVESDFEHRAAVDCLKWQLGQPTSWLPPPLTLSDWPPLSLPRPDYGYDDYCYYYYGGERLDRMHYNQGFRDGLAAFSRGGGSTGGKATSGQVTPTASTQSASACGGGIGAKRMSVAAGYPGDLMEFPSASYRRPVGPVPVSNFTSYDDLTLAWPYGCKPFYYRRADPPSVRYC